MSDAEDLTLKDLIRYYEMEEAVASAIKQKYGSIDKIPQVPERAISTQEAAWILISLFVIHPLWLLIADQLFFDIWPVTEAIRDFANTHYDGWFAVTMGAFFYVMLVGALMLAIGDSIHEYAKKDLARRSDSPLSFKYELRKLVRDLDSKWDREDRDARRAEIDLEALRRTRKREREEPMRAAWRRINLHKNDWGLAFEEPPETFRIAFFEAEKYSLNPALRIVNCLPSLPH